MFAETNTHNNSATITEDIQYTKSTTLYVISFDKWMLLEMWTFKLQRPTVYMNIIYLFIALLNLSHDGHTYRHCGQHTHMMDNPVTLTPRCAELNPRPRNLTFELVTD